MLSIRAATVNDAFLLKSLIYEFAEYERERDRVVITEADLVRDGFGPEPKFRALIAQWDEQAAGCALFFGFYSAWDGRPGVFLEDLFVRQSFRGKGIGGALLAAVARIAQRENCYGMRWEVLDWNQPAIDFYKGLGATFLDQRKSVVLTEEARCGSEVKLRNAGDGRWVASWEPVRRVCAWRCGRRPRGCT